MEPQKAERCVFCIELHSLELFNSLVFEVLMELSLLGTQPEEYPGVTKYMAIIKHISFHVLGLKHQSKAAPMPSQVQKAITTAF